MRFSIEAGADTMELAAKHGISGVPLGADKLLSAGSEEALASLSERGLRPCQISAFGFNTLRPDKEAKAAVEKVIGLAPRVGCSVVVMPGGNYNASQFGGSDKKNFTDDAIDAAANELESLVRAAEDAGVALSIEPYVKGVIHSPAAFKALHGRLSSSSLKINLDITNFYDLEALIDPDPVCRKLIPELNGHVGIIHVKDIGLEDGFHIHAGLKPITEGPTDWGLVLELAATAAAPDVWLLLEHVLSKAEANESIAHLRALAADRGITLD
jgi:sugar phosphate isomerase/epimerase